MNWRDGGAEPQTPSRKARDTKYEGGKAVSAKREMLKAVAAEATEAALVDGYGGEERKRGRIAKGLAPLADRLGDKLGAGAAAAVPSAWPP